MLDDYMNKDAEIFFRRFTETERAWAKLVVDVLRERFRMADHWTTGGERKGYIDIRVGRRLKDKSRGLPAFYIRRDNPVSLQINMRALSQGAPRNLSSRDAPQLEDIVAWIDDCEFSDAGRQRLQGSGRTPADYGDDETDEEGVDEEVAGEQRREMSQPPLNLILYGPPGTGKTYNTIREALKVLEATLEPVGTYEAQTIRFNDFRTKGQVAFVTFHQSFSYEDFIEGIRAETVGGVLSYRLRDGILKRMAITAMYGPVLKNAVRTEIDFDELYDEFLKNVAASLPFEINGPLGGRMEIRTITSRGTLNVTHAGSELSYGVSRNRLKDLYQVYPKSSELEGKPSSSAIRDVIGGANSTAYWGALKSLLNFREKVGDELLEEGSDPLVPTDESDYEKIKHRVLDGNTLIPNGKPYVLIIDEINRANMSRVFGELITLIEPSKRAGREEAAEVQLPYSGDRFSVPSNLYIIGTMNTADRSLAVVDTALRRRFDFVEKMPDPSLLRRKEIDGVDLVRLLEVINLRIEYLYDREHMIGHAFFMALTDDSTLADVARIFKNNVLPLLEEYFFEDWEKISMILGNSGIYELRSAANLGFVHAGKTYRRNLERLQHVATYQAIYRGTDVPSTIPTERGDA